MRKPALNISCRAVCLGGLALCLAACGRKAEPPAAPPAEPAPLVRVNDRALTEEDFQFEVQRRVQARRPVGDPESVLREMIEREVMLQEARKSEWIDAETQRDLENQKLVRWLERTLQVEKDKVSLGEEDVRQFYDANIDQHRKPALMRLAVLYRKTSPLDPSESREALKAELEKARAAYLADPQAARQGGRMQGFGTVAAEYSEDAASRYRGGDLGWLEHGRTDYRWPQEILEAGHALGVGEVGDVLATEEGLYVVMKTDFRDAQTTPFEEVASTLRRRLLRERQAEVEQTFMSTLMARSRIEIDSERAAQLSLPDPAAGSEAPALRPASDFTPDFTGLQPQPDSTP